MDEIIDDIVSPADLTKFEIVYNNQLRNGCVTKESKFEYAFCLVRSKYHTDIRKGIVLLEELCKKYKDDMRCYLYYLAVGNARVKEYSKALQYCRQFLLVEPNNPQVQTLEENILAKLHDESMHGLKIAGGVLAGVGAVIGAGFLIAGALKNSRSRSNGDDDDDDEN